MEGRRWKRGIRTLITGPEPAEGERALHNEHVAFAVGGMLRFHHDDRLCEPRGLPLELPDDGHFLVIHEVPTYARGVDDNGDVELREVLFGADAAEHEELRRVEGAAGEDDFLAGGGRFEGPLVGGGVPRVGFVDGFPLEVLDACGAGDAAAGGAVEVEEDAGGEAGGAEFEGELLLECVLDVVS